VQRVGDIVKKITDDVIAGKDERLVAVRKEPGRYGLLDNVRDFLKVDEELQSLLSDLAGGRKPWPLLLHGEAGSGKTCAGLAMLDIWGGRFTEFTKLCSDLRLAMQGELFTPICQGTGGYRMYEADIWKPWTASNLTVLDDFGVRNPTDFQYDTLLAAIKSRHAKPAIFISNMRLQDIERRFDDRIASRLGGGTVYGMSGDRRNTPQ